MNTQTFWQKTQEQQRVRIFIQLFKKFKNFIDGRLSDILAGDKT